MLATSLSQEVLGGFLYTVTAGIALVLFSALVSVVRNTTKKWRQVKEAPVRQDAADIASLKIDVADLKTGFSEINGWLRGGKDLLGREKHDGFIETFPQYQDEVRSAFSEVGAKLDALVPIIQNGHGKTP